MTTPGDPDVSRVLYALRDLGVAGPAEAADVLEVCSHGLDDGQVQQVLDGLAAGGWISASCT